MELCFYGSIKIYEYWYIINVVAMATITFFFNKVSTNLEDRMCHYALLINKKNLKTVKKLPLLKTFII